MKFIVSCEKQNRDSTLCLCSSANDRIYRLCRADDDDDTVAGCCLGLEYVEE